RAPLMTRSMRRTWSAPMRPVPMTATPSGSRRFMAWAFLVVELWWVRVARPGCGRGPAAGRGRRSGAAGAEEPAGAHRDRQRLVRVAGVHVLLDDGEEVHAQVLGGGEDGAQLGHAAGRFAHHAALDGGAE